MEWDRLQAKVLGKFFVLQSIFMIGGVILINNSANSVQEKT